MDICVANLRFWLANTNFNQTCWLGSSVMIWNIKYIFTKERQTQRWTFYYSCLLCTLICFHLQLKYLVYVKHKHATPANIHTEVAWSSGGGSKDWQAYTTPWRLRFLCRISSLWPLWVLRRHFLKCHCLWEKASKKASEVYLQYHFSLLFLSTKWAACQAKPCPWPDIWQAYRKKIFAGLN